MTLSGYVYEQEATRKLGGFFGFAADVSSKAHLVKESVTAVKAAMNLQQAQREMENTTPEQKATLEQKFIEDGLANFFKIGIRCSICQVR